MTALTATQKMNRFSILSQRLMRELERTELTRLNEDDTLEYAYRLELAAKMFGSRSPKGQRCYRLSIQVLDGEISPFDVQFANEQVARVGGNIEITL